jgi:hypothetical protein
MATIPHTTTPHQPVTALFPDSALLDKALGAMRTRALVAYPLERVRIERGFQLALTGKVELLPDGTALVQSQAESDTRYAVACACVCRDSTFNAPHGRCKHKWAKALSMKAQQALHAGETVPSLETVPPSYYSEDELEGMTQAIDAYPDVRAPGQTLTQLARAWKQQPL